MGAARLAVVFFAALVLYYARAFVLVHQQAATVVQIFLLLLAAAVAVAPVPVAAQRLSRLPAWLLLLAAIGLSGVVFVWADRDSRSVSDTLNRAVPAICVVLTIAIRLVTTLRAAPALR